jgi:hypothetical protein
MGTVCHDTIADLLLALPPGQVGTIVGVRVRRCPYGAAWGVAGGPPLSLLPAVDALMAAAGYHAARTPMTPAPRPPPPPRFWACAPRRGAL